MVVRVIPPSEHTPTSVATQPRLVRTAAYCRVSTTNDAQETSYEAQRSHYVSYIVANPSWTLAGVYADEGITGTQAKRRPEFQRMIRACKAGHIDQIITKSISRFARNTLDCLNYIRELKALGIPVIFEKESINTMDSSGEVLLTILASIAQQESASISANVRMGIEYRFQEGHGRIKYSTFLGYTRDSEPGTYRIVPQEAQVVRRIYQEYLSGFGPHQIANRLQQDGIRAPAGGVAWYASTINSILRNEKYCGDLLMQKYCTVDFLTHKVVRNEDQRPQYFVERDHEPIVPKTVFYQVQEEARHRAGLAIDPSKARYGDRIALTGRLVCSECGGVLRRHAHKNGHLTDWRCVNRNSCANAGGQHRCASRIVKERAVQEAVVRAFNELPYRTEELQRAYEQTSRGDLQRIDASLRELEELQAKLERQQTRPDTKRLQEVQQQKDALHTERARYANEALNARRLLELVAYVASQREKPSALSAPEPPRESESPDPDPSCHDADDFYRRTATPPPAGTLGANGLFVSFNNELVIRFVEKIVVLPDAFLIQFKAGISVRVVS